MNYDDGNICVSVYKDDFCDPDNKIGTRQYFSNGKDVEYFIKTIVAACKPTALHRLKITITDKTFSTVNLDHYVYMNEPLAVGDEKKIEFVDINDVAEQVNLALAAKRKRDVTIKQDFDRKLRDGSLTVDEMNNVTGGLLNLTNKPE